MTHDYPAGIRVRGVQTKGGSWASWTGRFVSPLAVRFSYDWRKAAFMAAFLDSPVA